MSLLSWSCRDSELEITWTLAHGPERVWLGLSTAGLIAQWLGKAVECDIAAGGRLHIDHGEGYISRSDITAVDVPTRLAMTWEFPDEPPSAVSIVLQTDDMGASTVLTLVHSGLGDLTDSYRAGWMTHLSYLEAAVDGSPLPSSEFWNLHATLDVLVTGL